MKLTTKITSLLLTAFAAVSIPAVHAAPASTGKVGNVTFALTLTYEEGGFDGEYYKTVTDTDTSYKQLYKSMIKSSKYSTKELIADLYDRYELPGSAGDYSIKYVESEDSEFRGFFIVNKAGDVAVYIGGDVDTNRSLPINTYYVDDYNDTLYNETGSYVSKQSGNIRTSTWTSSWNSQTCGTYIYFNPRNEEDYFETFALVKGGGSYKSSEKYDSVEEDYFDETETYTVSATSITDIIGTNYDDGLTLTGSVKISALKDTADVGVFYDAFIYYID